MISSFYVQHICEILKLARKTLGHTKIPAEFVIPKSPEWPAMYHNFCFGRKLSHLRRAYTAQKLSKEQISQLEDEHMVWNLNKNQYNFYLSAMLHYKSLYGELNVPWRFVVPQKEEWCEAFWGMELGKIVGTLRRERARMNNDRLQQLNEIGFVWNMDAFKLQHVYLPGLKWYKENLGLQNVPYEYEIPKNEHVPKKLRGVKLGGWVYRMRRKQAKDEKGEDLLQLPNRYDVLIQLLKDYHDKHGHLHMPQNYEVNGKRLGKKFKSLVAAASYYDYYDAKVMEPLGLYRNISNSIYENIVKAELNEYRAQHNTKIIYFNTPGSYAHLGYLKYHCKHPKLVDQIKKLKL